MNPLMMMFAAMNPEMAGTLFDQAQIPVPAFSDAGGTSTPGAMLGGGLGQLVAPQMTQPAAAAPSDLFMGGGGLGGMMDPAAAAPAAGGASPQQAALMQGLKGLQGVKAPEPIKPIMAGGVAGGVKPPEMSGKAASASAPAIQALIAAALAGSGKDPLRVPVLSQLMG